MSASERRAANLQRYRTRHAERLNQQLKEARAEGRYVQTERTYRNLNQDKNREYQRTWARKAYAQDPTAVLNRNHERRVKTASNFETLTYMQILRGDPCAYCGEPHEHIDHIHPLSRGGKHHWTNLTSSCQHCNQSKNASTLLQFLERNDFNNNNGVLVV